MFEKPLTMYEMTERKREMALREVINKNLFSLHVALLMMQEIKDASLRVEEFIKNPNLSIYDIIHSIDEYSSVFEEGFKRALLMAVIRRADCPKVKALEYGRIVFPDVKDKIRKESKDRK